MFSDFSIKKYFLVKENAVKQRYDQSDIRRLNVISVLNQLRLNGAMSRANLSVRLGLTRATISNIVTDLMQASLISETVYAEGGAGRPGILLNLNPDAGCMIAVEIDLDRIWVVLTNVGQGCIWREDVSLPLEYGADESLELAAGRVARALEIGALRGLSCFGICVAWSGLVDGIGGQLAYGPISGWEQVALKRDWELRFEVPVHVENEAHAGAIGAYHFGLNRGVDNLIYLSLGVGLAAGVFVNGALMRGDQGYAGQVGHTFFAANQITCGCGKEGCWVTEIGATAIHRKLLAANVILPVEASVGFDWLECVHEQALVHDAKVLQVLKAVGRQLGEGLARLVQTFNPSVVIVGGRLGKLMQRVEPTIKEALLAEVLPCMAERIDLRVSDSDEDQRMGCLATVYDAIMQNPPIGGETHRSDS